MTLNYAIQMHNPPHPGELIEGVYLEPCGLSIRQVAERLALQDSHDLRQIRKPLAPISARSAFSLNVPRGHRLQNWQLRAQ